MGIRFHCPNGHKLNVKSFLAGKKGVCPDCGVKVRIPDRSEAGLESGIDEGKHSAKGPIAAVATAAASAPAMTLPVAAPAAQAAPKPAPTINNSVAQPAVVPFSALRPGATMAAPAVVAQPTYAAPVSPAALPPPPPAGRIPGAPVDPIAENPLATWFVRPPSGGQFGPARGEVMRKWLTEGRVTSDSLVWREGWADWLPATEVFPTLGKPTPPLVNAVVTTSSVSSVPVKKSGGSLGAVLLIILALVCVGLTAVLGYVVLSGGFSST